MLTIRPKYHVNEKGPKGRPVLSMKGFRALLQRLADRDDA